MSRLAISLLGPFQVMLDGEPVHHFETNKARALLAYLAVENTHPHPRSTLAELLWPERAPGGASANLRHTLARLRKAIDDANTDPPFLLVTRQTIQLNPLADIQVDVAELDALADSTSLHRTINTDATKHYRGPFMDGFAVDGCPELETWIVVTRERLARTVMRMLDKLIHDGYQRHAVDQAIGWAEQQMDIEPWNEEIQQRLIWLLGQDGRRSAALRQYEQCREMLADGFGVAPQPDTEILAEAIRDGDTLPAAMPGPATDASASPPSRDAAILHDFANARGPLLGRDAELCNIDQQLRDPGCRLLTIIGVGGVGKTRLALEAAERCANRYRDGVCFVPLAAVERSELLVNAILQALNAQVSGAANPPQQLLRYLADKEILLVLDNFEQLIENGPFLAILFESAPRLDILATSRERLNLSIEWLLPLEGLETPKYGTPPAAAPTGKRRLDSFAAVQLFIERMRQLQPNPALDEETMQQIGRICRLLDGLPLAIELAAAWTRLLTLDEMIEQLTQGIDLLSTTQRDVPARHRNMRAVFDHSWQLLPSSERIVLAQLAVFRGGFSLDGAEAVAGASLTDLSKLLDSSWLRKRSSGRYDMHELVRQYCVSRLIEESGEPGLPIADEVYHRHCSFYGAFMDRMAQRINFQIETMAEIHAEFGNLQASWHWALAHDQMDIAVNIVFFLWFYLDMLGRFRFGLRLMEDYAEQVQIIFSGSEPGSQRHQSAGVVLAWLKHVIGNYALELGLIELTCSGYDSRHSIVAQLMPDERVTEFTLHSDLVGGQLDYGRGRFYNVIRQRLRGVQKLKSANVTYTLMGKELGKLFWIADSYSMMAEVAWRLGQYNRSIDYYVKCFEYRRAGGEQRFSAQMNTSMAQLAWILGEYNVAVQFARDSANASQRLGDRMGVGFAHLSLGQAELAMGKFRSALKHLQASLNAGQQSGQLQLTMVSLTYLGHLMLTQGDADQAIAYAREALETFENLHTAHSVHLSGAWLLLGRTALIRQTQNKAEHYFLKTMHARGRAAWEAMDALAGLAEVHMRRGDTQRAVRMFATVVNATMTADSTRCHVDQLVRARGLPVETSHRVMENLAEIRQSFQRLTALLLSEGQ